MESILVAYYEEIYYVNHYGFNLLENILMSFYSLPRFQEMYTGSWVCHNLGSGVVLDLLPLMKHADIIIHLHDIL